MAACGQVDEEVTSSNDSTKQEKETPLTSQEVTTKNNSNQEEALPSFDGDIGTFHFVGIYTNEEMEENEGSYPVDFEGFHINVTPILVDIELNELGQQQYDGKTKVRAIQLTTEAENTNDFNVDYNGTITIVTSDGEQLSSDSGVLSENPVAQTYMGKVKEVGAFTISLDDNAKPEKIELIMEPPYKVENGSVDPVNGVIGEEQHFAFEFISKEELGE